MSLPLEHLRKFGSWLRRDKEEPSDELLGPISRAGLLGANVGGFGAAGVEGALGWRRMGKALDANSAQFREKYLEYLRARGDKLPSGKALEKALLRQRRFNQRRHALQSAGAAAFPGLMIGAGAGLALGAWKANRDT